MAASGKQPSSRWGSFLSQAVAGVEARLDTILADDNEKPAQQQQQQAEVKRSTTPVSPVPSSPSKQSPGMA
jgi:TATA element modulatory factor